MADWRQNDSGKPARKPKSVAKPSKEKKAPQASSPSSPSPKKGWRRKPGAVLPDAVQASTTRSWTGSADHEVAPVSAGSLRKWFIVGSLSVLTIVGIIALTVFAFMQPRPLRIVLISAGDYQSPELLSNPFATLQHKRLGSVNSTNIRGLSFDEQSAAIASLANDTFLQGIEAVTTQTVPVGGPNKKVVAFYISSYVIFDEKGEIYLQSPKDSPFSLGAGGTGVALSIALENIAKAVQPGAMAWVILDVQLPPVLGNLGDLNRPWATATSAAIARLDADLQQRLLVTLPCDDGQKNWLAPEHSSSFFGYYVHELLAGRNVGKTTLSQDLHFDEFSRLLGERTAYGVAKRRFAEQTPVWLPEASFEASKEYGLVTIGSVAPVESPATLPSAEQMSTIEKLWTDLAGDDYQAAYRWDPMGYATAESQLLGLEDVAIYQPDKFGVTKDRVVKAIDEIKRPQVYLGVSLVEDRLRDTFFNQTMPIRDHAAIDHLAGLLFSQLESGGRLPSFWSPPPAESIADADAGKQTPPSEAMLNSELRPELVWEFYRLAASGNLQQWESVFQPARLNKALAYAGQESPSTIEMNLLKRLARDVDWEAVVATPGGDTEFAIPACRQAVMLFHRIQSMAAHPDNQASRWLTSRLPEVEQQYMRGVDLLLANQFEQAQIEFSAVQQALEPILHEHQVLLAMLDEVNRTLYVTPHLLAWLLKEYPLADRTDVVAIESRLKNLGTAINSCSQFYRLLQQDLSKGVPADLRRQRDILANASLGLQDDFQEYVSRKTAANDAERASASPLSFRRARIALLSPLTPPEMRTALHVRVSDFLAVEFGTDFEEKTPELPEQRSIAKAVEQFLGALDFDHVNWGKLVQSDVRRSLDGLLSAIGEPNTPGASGLHAELLKSEYWLRAYAASIGSNPTLHGRLSAKDMDRNGWPWTSAWQRWILSESFHRNYQTQRLATASWGDGVFTNAVSGEQVLFYKLGQNYTLPGDFTRLEPVSRLKSEFTEARKTALEESLDRLKQLRVELGGAKKINLAVSQQLTPVRVMSARWSGVANVFLRHNGKRSPWLKNAPADRGWAADLDSGRELESKKFLDTSYWSIGSEPPSAAVAIRGNKRIVPLDWEVGQTNLTPLVLQMTKVQPDGATLVVRSPNVRPTINVMLLIDCSASMDTEVQGFVEGQSVTGGAVRVSEKVKRVVRRVLTELAAIHGREANVQLSIMPFGLGASDAEQISSLLLARNDSLDVLRTQFRALDQRWLGEIEGTVDKLIFKGDTPLYAAIVEACQVAQLQSGDRSFIYVFSDGVDHTNDGTSPLARKSQRDVERAFQTVDRTFVSVFHFDYFEAWIAAMKFSDGDAARWRKEVFNPGIVELSNLSSTLKDKFNYQKSRNDEELLAESLSRLPNAKVQVFAKAGGQEALLQANLDEQIRVLQGDLPEHYEVRVTGELGNADTTIELIGGEYVELQLKPNTPRLQHVAVDFNRKDSPAKSNDKLGSEAFLLPKRKDLSANSPLGLAINFGSSDPNEFTFRPKFIVAEVTQHGGGRSAPTVVLSDHRFTSRISYPQAQLGYFEWPESRPEANVRVWAANGLPKMLQLMNVDSGEVLDPVKLDSPRFDGTRIRVEHRGDRVDVHVTYAQRPLPQQRAVIICPAAARSYREFARSQVREKHSFELSDHAKSQTVQLQLATIADLEASKQGDLTELVFPPISTR